MSDIKTKLVKVTILAEAAEDSSLDPGQYDIDITSKMDPWFDMYPKSVTMTEVES